MLTLFTRFAAACNDTPFLGIFPKWYKYLPHATSADGHCEINLDIAGKGFSQLWLIGLALIDILLRVAGLVAVAFVIYGGIRYVTSQGEPDNIKKAQETIVNALIGAVIVILASAFVSFLGNKLGG